MDDYYRDWHANAGTTGVPHRVAGHVIAGGIIGVVLGLLWAKGSSVTRRRLLLIFVATPAFVAAWVWLFADSKSKVPSQVLAWLSVAWIIWVIWCVVTTTTYLGQQLNDHQAEYRQAQHDAVVQAGVDKVRYDHAVARVTGQAVAEALRDQRPPDEPTGAPQRPTTPPPTPPAPMGSSTPTLWVPTYHGPRRELQRRETSLEGIWMNDHRRIDPDDL